MMQLTFFARLGLAAFAFLPWAEAKMNYGEKIRHNIYGRNRQQHVLREDDVREADPNTFRYYNQNSSQYRVKSLPDVPFNIGELYSGLIPIDENDPSRQLFFAWQPTIGAPVDEITIWLNGGPGCSSLDGFFQENGRFLWEPGVYGVYENPYSWVNLTNMLWVEQPVGTGFSIGKVEATSEEDLAADFVKWFKNFQNVFGIKNHKIYVTGESYAGRYVPYISAAILDQKDKTYYDLHGAITFDPCIGQYDYVQEEATIVPLVNANPNLFNFNASFTKQINALHETCGYKDFIDRYMKFPATETQPPLANPSGECDVFTTVWDAVYDVNPCFNIYEINAACPILGDVLGFPTGLEYYGPGINQNYFDRTDVKQAMHAPMNVDWQICSANPVFAGNQTAGPEQNGDLSADSIQKVLPQVIESTNRVLIANGDYDAIIITNGTLLSIQNMTWNGKLGFQQQPSKPINIHEPDLQYGPVFAANMQVEGQQGIMGIQHYERGLMWAETFQSGHMEPEFQARVAYRYISWVLGRIQTL